VQVAIYWTPRHLSYDHDWKDALLERYPDADLCTVKDGLIDSEIIYWLHGLTAQKVNVPSWLKDRRGKLVILSGNDYKNFEEKEAAYRTVEADLIGALAPNCPFTNSVHIPHGLHPPNWPIGKPFERRPIGVGFRGYKYPDVGDDERNTFVEKCMIPGLDVKWEIFINHKDYRDWLGNCRATVATEAGMVGRKAISSRQFESIGLGTALVMVEGYYSGCLTKEHYFAVNKDMSNLQDKLRQSQDAERWKRVTRLAREHVMENHTLAHRISKIEEFLWQSPPTTN
jgi:hypothetical protein